LLGISAHNGALGLFITHGEKRTAGEAKRAIDQGTRLAASL
jgi:hypothetical protein